MPILFALHPATAFYGMPYEAGTFIEDVKRWGRMQRGELEAQPRVQAGASIDDLLTVRRRGLAGEPVSYDIETSPESPARSWTGKDPTRAVLKAIGFGFTDWAVAFFWGENPEKDALAKQILEDGRIQKVGVNVIWYDNRVLARSGIRVMNFEDCRDARRAASSTSRLSLAYMGSLYTDYFAWKLKNEYEDGK